MTWERDPLWAKAKLFFERAFSGTRDDPEFGLWCSLGLELLGRAAVASVSPALLAEPDREHKYLLHALNRGSQRTPPRSIAAHLVFALCRTLFPEFTEDDAKIARALVNRRNEELHSGAAAFEHYGASQWLTGFYRACQTLSESMDESLDTLFGEDEANVANELLAVDENAVRQEVQNKIAAHRNVFREKSPEEQGAAAEVAEQQGAQLALERHHRVKCPACECMATVRGTTFGKVSVAVDDDGDIIVRQAVSPTSFACKACGLRLEGYAELATAGLGGRYTRRCAYSPEAYYGLVDPDNLDEEMVRPYLEAHLERFRGEYDLDYWGGPEYDNE